MTKGIHMKRINTKSLRRFIAVLGVVLMLFTCCGAFAQPAAAKPVAVGGGGTYDPLSVSKSNIYFGPAAQSTTVTVKNVSSYSVSITSGNTFVSVSKSGNTLTIKASANNTGGNRNATIYITSGSQNCKIYVTQYKSMVVRGGANYATTLSQANLSGVSGLTGSPSTTVQVINPAGTLKVTSNSSWITVSTNGNYVTITAKPNTSGGNRTGSIKLTNGYETRTFSVYQLKWTITNICAYPYMDSAISGTIGNCPLLEAYRPFKDAAAWSAMTMEQQNAALQNLLAAAKQWYGIPASRYLPAYYDTRANLNSKYAAGLTSTSYAAVALTVVDNTPVEIYLNYDLLKNNPVEAVKSILHECRHVWQSQRACYGGTAMQYLFKYNLDPNHYIRAEIDANGYWNQFVEVDARGYADRLWAALQRSCK